MLALEDPVADAPVLNTAVRLAGRSGARLHVVNVRRTGFHIGGSDQQDIIAAVVAASDELQETVSFELVETGRNGRRAHVIAEELAEYAHRHDIDLVVLGTHAWHSIGRFILGSVSAAIPLETCIPILMIPRRSAAPQPSPRRLQHILVALDRPVESEPLVNDAADIACLMGSGVTLLSVVAPEPGGDEPFVLPLRHEEFVLRCARSEEFLDRQAERLRDLNLPVTAATLVSASFTSTVKKIAATQQADLIVVGTSNSSTLLNTLAGTTQCALLVREIGVPAFHDQLLVHP